MPSHEEFCATCSGRIFRAKPLSDMLGSRLHLHSNAHEEKMRHFLRIVTLVMAPRAEHARPLGIALITRINPKRLCHRAHDVAEHFGDISDDMPVTEDRGTAATGKRCNMFTRCEHLTTASCVHAVNIGRHCPDSRRCSSQRDYVTDCTRSSRMLTADVAEHFDDTEDSVRVQDVQHHVDDFGSTPWSTTRASLFYECLKENIRMFDDFIALHPLEHYASIASIAIHPLEHYAWNQQSARRRQKGLKKPSIAMHPLEHYVCQTLASRQMRTEYATCTSRAGVFHVRMHFCQRTSSCNGRQRRSSGDTHAPQRDTQSLLDTRSRTSVTSQTTGSCVVVSASLLFDA